MVFFNEKIAEIIDKLTDIRQIYFKMKEGKKKPKE